MSHNVNPSSAGNAISLHRPGIEQVLKINAFTVSEYTVDLRLTFVTSAGSLEAATRRVHNRAYTSASEILRPIRNNFKYATELMPENQTGSLAVHQLLLHISAGTGCDCVAFINQTFR